MVYVASIRQLQVTLIMVNTLMIVFIIDITPLQNVTLYSLRLRGDKNVNDKRDKFYRGMGIQLNRNC